MAHFDNLTLYYRMSCPYCVKVIRYMEANDITMNMKDTTDPANLETLIERGGKQQVPCLFIDGKPMYESNDIIDYLSSIR